MSLSIQGKEITTDPPTTLEPSPSHQSSDQGTQPEHTVSHVLYSPSDSRLTVALTRVQPEAFPICTEKLVAHLARQFSVQFSLIQVPKQRVGLGAHSAALSQ